jgi:predicted Zn-dependent peptidase
LISTRASRKSAAKETGLPQNHPLLRFFGKEQPSLVDYLALDVITGAFEAMSKAHNTRISNLAARLRNRDLYKALAVC